MCREMAYTCFAKPILAALFILITGSALVTDKDRSVTVQTIIFDSRVEQDRFGENHQFSQNGLAIGPGIDVPCPPKRGIANDQIGWWLP